MYDLDTGGKGLKLVDDLFLLQLLFLNFWIIPILLSNKSLAVSLIMGRILRDKSSPKGCRYSIVNVLVLEIFVHLILILNRYK